MVKSEILKQRIDSKFDSKKLESKLESLMKSEAFSAKILQTSHSTPSFKATA